MIGVPVLAVLLVLDLAVLAIGVACGAGGVGLIATAFIGLPMVADMLILLGGGAAVIAIALVVIWLAIWLFIRMVIGWVRLLVRLGKRWYTETSEGRKFAKERGLTASDMGVRAV